MPLSETRSKDLLPRSCIMKCQVCICACLVCVFTLTFLKCSPMWHLLVGHVTSLLCMITEHSSPCYTRAGRNARYCMGLYFRLKNSVFCGSKPYSSEVFDKILKEEFGEETLMSELPFPRCVCVWGFLVMKSMLNCQFLSFVNKLLLLVSLIWWLHDKMYHLFVSANMISFSCFTLPAWLCNGDTKKLELYPHNIYRARLTRRSSDCVWVLCT